MRAFKFCRRLRESVFGEVSLPKNSSKNAVSMLKLARAGLSGGEASGGREGGPLSLIKDKVAEARVRWTANVYHKTAAERVILKVQKSPKEFYFGAIKYCWRVWSMVTMSV